MAHQEYIREIPGSDTVVLCIHGIFGTPDIFKPILTQVPDDWSVFNILLDGHGKSVQDFARSSMAKWKGQVQRTLTYLSVRYSKIIIAGHSMGTLFALQAADGSNPRIKALFLLDVPLMPILRPSCASNSLQILYERIPAHNKVAFAHKAAVSVIPDKRVWRYLTWFPRIAELIKEIEITRNYISKVKVPCRVFLSQKDELVSLRSYRYMKGNPRIKVTMLHGATHFYFSEENTAQMQRSFASMCRKVKSMPYRK